MPTIFIVFGFIFKFFSDDHEPIHVHVIKGGCEAKYNVEPEVVLVYNHGFKMYVVTEKCTRFSFKSVPPRYVAKVTKVCDFIISC